MKKQNYLQPDLKIEMIKLEDAILTSVGTDIGVGELAGTDEVKDIIYW